ncbi:MAG: hypothetical protein BWY43_00664 [candidate division WS2 bacterium ADurb.Bin280]|uniref:Uncharacterized protein n=1 Tax=candidate division WS2 bacterium ADurb.Bin280 TaxID=1852829 RepID=A0A1V5SC38_9BACT|nr:MAG: hypothetical protein BWY43_00664 [candidate division WS2 bacterium ADurb.Bin280]
MINKTCIQCSANFTVTDADLEFYKKISPTFDGKTFEIPAPTLCPDCRRQKRIAWRNVGKFYKRKSDLSGREMISCFASNSKFRVWHLDEWMGGEMDPYQYGKDFDFSRSFFEQLFELEKEVPLPHMNVARNENSEYINNSSDCKDSYLIENSTESENSLYSLGLFYSRDCVDCLKAFESENCYECINIENCYGCYFCKDSVNCSESLLLEDCNGCKNCYGCANVSNKQYWVFNAEKTREEFEKMKQELLSADIKKRVDLIAQAKSHLSKLPKKFAHELSNENSRGDYIYHSKNSQGFFLDNCEDTRDATNLSYCKDFINVDYWGDHSEISYESAEVGTKANNVLFSRKCYGNVANIFYSLDCCFGSHDLFGCCGLKHGEYSIFNKKYPKSKYEKLVSEIIEHMKKTGEWGEFFPLYMSQFAYNETSAMDHFPLTKEEAVNLGSYWQDHSYDQNYDGTNYEPLDISEYKSQEKADELLKSVLICAKSGRPYKIQPQELAYYLKNNLQIPRYHPDERYRKRFEQVNPQKTWHRKCMKEGCQNEFETTYAPDRPEKVYCESCYQKSVL